MKTKFKIFIFLFAFISIFQSCTPEPLEIILDPVESQVVVFSQVIPNTVMTVLLTNTLDALDFSEEEGDTLTNNVVDQFLVSDAKVSISYAGQTDSLFEVADGFYLSFAPSTLENVEYTLRIVTKEGAELEARSLMLPLVELEIAEPIIERMPDDTVVNMAFAINDPPGDNWYMLNFYTKKSEEDTTDLDINTFFTNGSNVEVATILISDEEFENMMYQDTLSLESVLPTDSLVMTLSNINEDYYNFLSLRKRSQNLFTELVNEPINYPTNVENGLGFFNTHFPDIHFFDLNEY